MLFSCQSCGTCCRIYNVPVTESDIYRITNLTGKSPEAFSTIVRPDKSVADTYADIPKIKINDAEDNVLALMQDEESCIFLHDNKCNIYRARPLVCKPFPFYYSIENQRAVKFTVNDDAPGFCRGLGKGSKEFDFDGLRKSVILMEKESSVFRKKVKRWNDLVASERINTPNVKDLLEFLLSDMKHIPSRQIVNS